MTVSTKLTFLTVNGNGSARVFSFAPIVIPDDSSQIKVFTIAPNGTRTQRLEGYGVIAWSHNIVTFPSTGSITYPSDPAGAALPAGHTILIQRQLELVQKTDLRNQAKYYPEDQENQFDRGIMIAQQLKAEIDGVEAGVPSVGIITGIEAGAGIEGGGDSGNVVVAVTNDGITPAMLDAGTAAKKTAMRNRLGVS